MFTAITLARYSCAPRQGRLKIALQVFGYLKHHPKAAFTFNTDASHTLKEEKLNKGWKDLYPYVEENIPRDEPEPKGNGLKISTEVDADHTHDLETEGLSQVFCFC